MDIEHIPLELLTEPSFNCRSYFVDDHYNLPSLMGNYPIMIRSF